jgi:hypothetical protein
MPNTKKMPLATFVGGPMDGQTAPCFIAPHDFVAKATLEENGATRRWHWYKLVSGQYEAPRYEYVKAEDGEWPSEFGHEVGE